MNGMAWGVVHVEQEVDNWLMTLPKRQFDKVRVFIDLLAEQGPLLDEPYTRQLAAKLRELRISLGHDSWRITYFISTGRRIVLMTVFRKTRQRERREIERAVRTMERWLEMNT
jgi:phage-related protein